jgi:RNA polymerase sigma-70 factor (ECF subfamily)
MGTLLRMTPREPVAGRTEPDWEQAWAELRPGLLAYALHLARGDFHTAEDLVQDALVVAERRKDEWRAEGSLAAWLRGILKRLAFNERRLRKPVTGADRIIDAAFEDLPERSGENPRLTALRACREGLPANLRELLCLRYEDGLDYRTMAERTGMKTGAMKVRLMRLRQRLADCVKRRLEGA